MPFIRIAVFCCTSLFAANAFAHPLGNYSINQYFLIDMRTSPPAIFYLVDMAEIPSFTELDLLDTDFDSEVTDEETEKYLELKLPPLLANLALTVEGETIPLTLRDSRLALLAGQGGMVVFNLVLSLEPEQWPDVKPPIEFEIESKNYVDESGVRECKLVLDNHYIDDTRSLGDDAMKYQTLVYLDPNDNPVYQDFDAQFIVRLADADGAPVPADKATPLAFAWTATAKGATETGEDELAKAFGELLTDVSDDATETPLNAEDAPPEAESVTGESAKRLVEAPVETIAKTPAVKIELWLAGCAVLAAFVAGIWLGRASSNR